MSWDGQEEGIDGHPVAAKRALMPPAFLNTQTIEKARCCNAHQCACHLSEHLQSWRRLPYAHLFLQPTCAAAPLLQCTAQLSDPLCQLGFIRPRRQRCQQHIQRRLLRRRLLLHCCWLHARAAALCVQLGKAAPHARCGVIPTAWWRRLFSGHGCEGQRPWCAATNRGPACGPRNVRAAGWARHTALHGHDGAVGVWQRRQGAAASNAAGIPHRAPTSGGCE